MRKSIIFCISYLLCSACLFAAPPVTHYYKQIKVVTKDRKEQAGNGKGQFITFNDKGCYDSDNLGYTVNNGFLKLVKQTDERVYYSGNGYWGEVTYIFTENYKRLNIITDDGNITYVYVQDVAPEGVTTCELIKEEKKSDPVNSVIIPIVVPILNTPAICGICSGTGRCTNISCISGKITCSQCYGMGRRTYGSSLETCVSCNGIGYRLCTSCNGTGWCFMCRGTGQRR